jgi:hypothetical protein
MTAPNPWRTRFAYSVGINLILIVFMWFFFSAGSQKDQTYKEDREINAKAYSELQAKLNRSDSLLSIRDSELAESTHLAAKTQDSLKRERMRLRGRVVPVAQIAPGDTVALYTGIAIRDSIITVQDTLISSLETEKEVTRFKNRVIRDLLDEKITTLDSAYTAQFELSQTLYRDLESKEKKIKRLERLSRFLGVSTGVATAVLILILL